MGNRYHQFFHGYFNENDIQCYAVVSFINWSIQNDHFPD